MHLALSLHHNDTDANKAQLNPTFVFHHQSQALYATLSLLGIFTVTVVPFSNSLCTSIVPSCASTISLAIANPKPLPPLTLERDFSTRYRRSNIYGSSTSGIPVPSSVIETIVFSSVSLAVSTISVPSYACQEALLTILNKTCCMRSRSMNAVISFSH